jgi:hypothetical protein
MGLDIVFYFEDGSTTNIHMCYSNFSRRVMSLEDMIKWNFTDHDGTYTELKLAFLIYRLVQSGYLKECYNPKPYKAVFC